MTHKDLNGSVHLEYCAYGEKIHATDDRSMPEDLETYIDLIMDYLSYNAVVKMRNNSNTKVKDSKQNCPHCNCALTWPQGVYKDGLVTTCCHEGCGKKSIMIDCYHCCKSIAWKGSTRDRLAVITCPHRECGKKFQAWNCTHCHDIIYNDRCNGQAGQRKCPYSHCGRTYEVSS